MLLGISEIPLSGSLVRRSLQHFMVHRSLVRRVVALRQGRFDHVEVDALGSSYAHRLRFFGVQVGVLLVPGDHVLSLLYGLWKMNSRKLALKLSEKGWLRARPVL
jgi:hypothetical protein